MSCTHKNTCLVDRWGEDCQDEDSGHPFRRICLDCDDDEWLPLGPTPPDTEAVRVERRAAFLATMRPGWYCTTDAWAGWEAHKGGWEPDPPIDSQAGWLARQIANHDAEQGGE